MKNKTIAHNKPIPTYQVVKPPKQREAKSQKPKDIILKNVPEEIWEQIRLMKIEILSNNKHRVSVSHQEALFKLVLKK